MYYDIVQQRLEIIRKFENLQDENSLESVLRDYLFDHLWLLDPGWDRATEKQMEKSIAKLFNKHRRNRQRFDLVATDPDKEAERLVSLGAARRDDLSDGFELADPDGNEFVLRAD